MRSGLQNNKGQALVEAIFLTTVFCSGLFFVLAVFHTQMVSIAVDDAIETYFFCQIQKNKFCKNSLDNTLNNLKLKKIKTHEDILNTTYEITVEADTNYRYQINKTRRLQFDFDLQF